MTPLKDWVSFGRGYAFREKTWYTQYHLGLDIICPAWTPLLAPFDGTSTSNPFKEGGNVIDFRANGLVFRFMHLAQISKTGNVKMGDIIGYTGNSGTLTTGAHLHVDISKGTVQVNNINNFLNPETFNWGEGGMMSAEFDTLKKLIEGVNAKVDNNFTALVQRDDANFNALWGWCNSLQDTIGKMASVEALQDPQIQKAVTDSANALIAAQKSTLTDSQINTLGGLQGIIAAIKNLFK